MPLISLVLSIYSFLKVRLFIVQKPNYVKLGNTVFENVAGNALVDSTAIVSCKVQSAENVTVAVQDKVPQFGIGIKTFLTP